MCLCYNHRLASKIPVATLLPTYTLLFIRLTLMPFISVYYIVASPINVPPFLVILFTLSDFTLCLIIQLNGLTNR